MASLPTMFTKAMKLHLTPEEQNNDQEVALLLTACEEDNMKPVVLTVTTFTQQMESFSFPIIYGLDRFESFASSLNSLLEQIETQLYGLNLVNDNVEHYINSLLNGLESYIVIVGFISYVWVTPGSRRLFISWKRNQTLRSVGLSHAYRCHSTAQPNLEYARE
jgi:hypothetical protein